MERLKKLLYRKEMLEHEMALNKKGGQVYADYSAMLNQRLKTATLSSYEKSKIKKEIYETDFKARGYIQMFKEAEREYNSHVTPKVGELVDILKIDRSSVEFLSSKALAKELATTEIYGKTTLVPADVELTAIMKGIEQMIQISENLIAELTKMVDSEKDPYQKSLLTKNLFCEHIAIINLRKRLELRKEYYFVQFLPRYTADMADAKKCLPLYLARAKAIVKAGIDIKLAHLLVEHKKHQEDKEKQWLFYTALKTRVEQVIAEIKKDKALKKKHPELIVKIV